MCIEFKKIYNKNITTSVMKRGLKKLGYTFKKNNFATRNRISKKDMKQTVKSFLDAAVRVLAKECTA